MALFYIQQDSKQVGPYTAKEIKQAVKAGRLARTDPIRVGEDGPWEIIEESEYSHDHSKIGRLDNRGNGRIFSADP